MRSNIDVLLAFQRYQSVIANIPWLPIVGNHEFYDGDELRRYLNQTEGNVVAHPADHPLVNGGHSTADTALGRILATGNHHGPGSNTKGSAKGTPSGTSRYYSVDFGLIHFVALDLNMHVGAPRGSLHAGRSTDWFAVLFLMLTCAQY